MLFSIENKHAVMFTGFTKLAFFDQFEGGTVHVVDLEDPKNVCENLADIPETFFIAKGMLLDDSVPMVCGRTYQSNIDCKCFAYNQSEWIAIPGPPTCAEFSASAKLIDQVDGKTRFVIKGGQSYVHAYDGKTWQSLPDLPSAVSQYCIVAINDTVLLSIGGRSLLKHDEKIKTYFFNSEMNEWFSGPDLIIERRHFSCSTVNWKNHVMVIQTKLLS